MSFAEELRFRSGEPYRASGLVRWVNSETPAWRKSRRTHGGALTVPA